MYTRACGRRRLTVTDSLSNMCAIPPGLILVAGTAHIHGVHLLVAHPRAPELHRELVGAHLVRVRVRVRGWGRVRVGLGLGLGSSVARWRALCPRQPSGPPGPQASQPALRTRLVPPQRRQWQRRRARGISCARRQRGWRWNDGSAARHDWTPCTDHS